MATVFYVGQLCDLSSQDRSQTGGENLSNSLVGAHSHCCRGISDNVHRDSMVFTNSDNVLYYLLHQGFLIHHRLHNCFCAGLHVAASLCLCFERLEISAACCLSSWFVRHPHLVHIEIRTPQKKYHNILHLVKTKNIRNTTIITCVVWSSIRIACHGFSLSPSELHGDPFLSCFISAATEIPADLSTWLAVKYVPRRTTIIFILLTTALSVFFAQLVPEGLSFIATALQVVGKLAVTAGAALMYSMSTQQSFTPQ
ncbi:organic cation/carnitine transporter 2-like [Antennarius striatus]|uniref:organic cation/carnitine transporter 2-like n=1 Tax=Antennarius striatus TaxID=241820 RepID=UPI0035AFDEDA